MIHRSQETGVAKPRERDAIPAYRPRIRSIFVAVTYRYKAASGRAGASTG